MSRSKIKHIAKIITEKSDLPNEVLSLDKLESFTGKILDKENDFSGDSFLGRKGDVVFAKIRPYLAKVAYLEKDMNVFTTLMLMRPNQSIDGKFVFWYMINQPFIDEANSLASGVTMPTIGWEELKNIEVYLPDLTTQQRIAAFLDTHTAKIDALSSELAKFKANLQFQKRSLVSECVTKGMPEDRDRAYKDSGLDYLALEMPLSWERMKLKNVLSKTTSGATPSSGDDSYYTDDDIAMPWVAIGDMDDNITTYTKNRVTEKALKECRLTVVPSGTLIYSMYASVGFVSELGMDATTNQAILALYLKDSVNKSFIKYWLKNMRYYVDRLTSVSTQANLNANKVLNLDLFLPSLQEQQKIADYLDAECAKIDSLINEIDNQIGLLKTYRKSLINEVVTGRVEV